MDFLLLGSNYFKHALQEMGHRAVWAGDDPACDLCLPAQKLDIPYIISRLSCSPEAIILTDDLGRRVFPSGLEKTSLLKVWYAVDGPLNFFWHKEYASLFDLVLVDQKDCAQKLFRLSAAKTCWLPVGIETELFQGPAEEKIYDLAFVGAVNKNVRPKRHRIIKLLSERHSVRTAGGRQKEWVPPQAAARLYRQARMVLNENLFDGVTTRMLEGMASGTMLFTEAAANGLEDLFQPGQDLAAFGSCDLLEQAEYYLKNEEERERIAARGREKVMTAHHIRHRAEILLNLTAHARPGTGLQEGGLFFSQQGKVLFLAATRWPDQGSRNWIMRAETMLKRTKRLNQADKDALFFLGLIQTLRNNDTEARINLEDAASQGSFRARLTLGYLALNKRDRRRAGQSFRQAVRQAEGQASFESDPFRNMSDNGDLSADQHHALGQLLEARGYDLTPGFSRLNLHMSMWNAFEHYYRAVTLDPYHLPALTRLGDLLMKYNANIEAYHFLARATEIDSVSIDLAQKANLAARRGYISVS